MIVGVVRRDYVERQTIRNAVQHRFVISHQT